MPAYKNHGRSGGFQKRPFNTNGPQKELFDSECSACGRRCQVPFRPNGKKPVFCSNCFTKDGQSAPRAETARREYAPRTAPAQIPDRQIQELNAQIKIMNETLEKLVVAVDTFNRATALTKEIRKHFPKDEVEEEKPKKAPAAAKKVAAKKVTKKK